MEFLDEETRPRILFQSRPVPQSPEAGESRTQSYHKPALFVSVPLSSLLIVLSLLYFDSEPLRSLLLWFAISLLVGPFAPSFLTAGDIRVGLGPTLSSPPPPQNEEETHSVESNKRTNRRSKIRKPQEFVSGFTSTPIAVNESAKSENGDDNSGRKNVDGGEEREWSEGDVELLRKQMIKQPVGKPGRWEAISEAFMGRHGVESVIKQAKSMGERKVGDSDSFARFLRDRKPVDKRIENDSEEADSVGRTVEDSSGSGWSSGEDIALLNALKAFPKDVSMRWEKIAAAVPSKSKAACMKRVTELKRDFRSSKASAET